MVYCPQCGTANKPNSKFCKNCAAVLMPSTDVRCPICGTMNREGAATCTNCGTRLTTTSTTLSDKASLADMPEHITPFTPPEQMHEANEGAPGEGAPPAGRRAFARSSSEWLRRLQKTPPPKATGAITAEPPAQAGGAPFAEPTATLASAPSAVREDAASPTLQGGSAPAEAANDVPEWLRDIRAEAVEQDAVNAVAHERRVEHQVEVQRVVEERAEEQRDEERRALLESSATVKPVLGEINLTGDDYDYSDIGGQVTDEMRATLEAQAGSVQSVEDEVALARRLLGLDAEEPVAASAPAVMEAPVAEMESPSPVVEMESTEAVGAVEAESPVAGIEMPAAVEPVEAASPVVEIESTYPVARIETTAAVKPVLGEIKLTGDDYDYGDIGGQVTDEMKATLEAQAGSVQSVEDEVALARRLLGLDVEEPAAASAPVVMEVAEVTSATEVMEAPTGTTVPAAMEAPDVMTAPVIETAEVEEMRLPAAMTVAEAPVETAPEIEMPQASSAEAGVGVEGERTDAVIPETPGWMSGLAEASPAVAAETVSEVTQDSPVVDEGPAPLELESGEMPEWLRDYAPRDIAARETAREDVGGAPAVPDTEAVGDELPEWVKELAPEREMGVSALLARLPDLDEEERGELPDWLREPIAPQDAAQDAPPVAEAGEGVNEAEGLRETPLELPAWFAETEPPGTTPRDPFEVIETTGPLAGISRILPLALAITEPHTLTTPTPVRSEGGRIFQTLLAEPLTRTSRAPTSEKAQGLFSGKHLLYLLILAAALVPLFLPLDQAGLGLDTSRSTAALFYDQLSNVPAGGAVLVAFDYTPGQAVEMDPAARAIVNTLAARKVNVIAVSSNPYGATMAQALLARAREGMPEFAFVNLGYVYGSEAGLKNLALGWVPGSQLDASGVSWGASPLARTVRGMDDLALTVLIVGDEASLRAWMEQVRPTVKTGMIGATTAMLEPQARNYVNANQLQASLRGLTGAAELELLSNEAGQAVKTVDALSVVSLLLAGILLAGNVVWVVRRGRKG